LIQRHTSDQVKADQAKADAQAVAAKAAAVAHQESQKNRVAALEDAMQDKEYTRSLEILRPDLHNCHKSVSNTDVDTLSNSHQSNLMLDDLPHAESLTNLDLLLKQSSYCSPFHEDYMTMPTPCEGLEKNAAVVGNNEVED